MKNWIYPLHFIDFETSAVALPFNKVRKPYEQVAFQFSHHKVNEDGSVEHANEFIIDEAGKFPNFEFVRALKKALEIKLRQTKVTVTKKKKVGNKRKSKSRALICLLAPTTVVSLAVYKL